MLILNRKMNQSVVIQTPGGDIEVTVTGLRGSLVGLGFDAPREFNIYRSEIEPLKNSNGEQENGE